MAVPLYDMMSVILIRLREGRSPFVGDRRHFSHRLVSRGLTPPQAVWTIDLVTLAGGLGALLLHRLGRVGGVRRRGPDVLLAGGRGHSGTLGEPFGASKWPDEWRNRRLLRSRGRRQGRTRDRRRQRWSTERDDGDRRQEAAETSERVRRMALGLTAALMTARAFWPSEPDLREGAGSGMYWVFARLHRVRAGADVGPGRRPLSLPLVVDRRHGRRVSWSWSR